MPNRICLAAAVLCALAGAPAAAQVRTGSVLERRVTVTFHQAPLESVLRTLHRQYGIRISYSNTALNLRQPVTLSAQNQPLRTVLSEVLDGKNIGYELVGDQLVLHPAPPKASAPKAAPAAAATTTTTVSRSNPEPTAEAPAPTTAAKEPTVRAATSAEPVKPAAAPAAKPKSAAPAKKVPGKPASGTAARSSATSRVSTSAAGGKSPSKTGGAKSTTSKAPASAPAAVASTPTGDNAVAANTPAPGATADAAPPAATPPATAAPAAALPTAAADSTAAPAAETPAEEARPTFTKPAQISLLGPLGSNGLRAGQTVNHLSINLLGGYAAGVEGFEAGGLVNVDRDTVAGVQLAGLANVVGRHLNGFQAAGLANVLGGPGRGVQAAGLLNLATRPVAGAQVAGLFNYAGPRKRSAEIELTASTADVTSTSTAAVPADDVPGSKDKAAQVAGLFNVALTEVRGGQVAGLLNVAHTVRGVQVAGLVNIADSVQGVSLAPFNFVRHGYHRLEATYSETWPVTLSLKLGGSAAFYTFVTAAYDGFGSGPRRWATGYGFGSDMWARRRLSLSLDAVAMQVNEEQRGVTDALNLYNQLRLLVGITPFKPGSHIRLVGGPTFSVLVTQRYDAAEGKVYSSLSEGRKLRINEGDDRTRVLGWYGYSVGLRF